MQDAVFLHTWGLTVGWWKEERHSSDTTARSAGFESQAGWASHGCCVLLYSCCGVQKKEKERVVVGGRGKYPGAPPHHIRKTSRPQTKTKADLMNNADPVETLAKIGKVKNLKDGGILLRFDNNSNLEQEVKGRLSENYEIHEVKPYRPLQYRELVIFPKATMGNFQRSKQCVKKREKGKGNQRIAPATKTSEAWHDHLVDEFTAAGIAEAEIAKQKGNVDSDGIPFTTVDVDGGWSKRSYGHNYNALSGTAIIIGKESKKALYMGVRNKFCYMWSVAANTKRKCSIQSSTEENIETVKRQMEDKPQLFEMILIFDDSITAQRYRNNILDVFITQLQLAQGLTSLTDVNSSRSLLTPDGENDDVDGEPARKQADESAGDPEVKFTRGRWRRFVHVPQPQIAKRIKEFTTTGSIPNAFADQDLVKFAVQVVTGLTGRSRIYPSGKAELFIHGFIVSAESDLVSIELSASSTVSCDGSLPGKQFRGDKDQRLQCRLAVNPELAEGREEELDVPTLTGGRCNRLASEKGSAFHPLIFS
ncbi:hypothetical protein GEV33_000059 [Tenebrio molitor]|uniref:Mutator-like transposase domain-containing protein n=1 Tax=Tenebrio molitor TaxID=7067 RepID=A0A8J6HZ89_TENMO|nr:hypothetical protein GEV33_000059 [Tenebrio molitor]